MKIKETILDVADEYANYSADDLGYPMLPKSSRAALCAALDAADAKLTAAVFEIARLTEDHGSTLMERDALKAENAALRDIDAIVSRFLAWELPQDFYPDNYLEFDKKYALERGIWPTGTNLFHAGQVRAMFEHCLQIDAARAALEKP